MTNTNENKVEILREKTVAFTGNRELKTPTGIYDANLENVIRTELRFNLLDCYNEGKNVFISGLAWGFDLLAAEEVIKLRTKYPDIKLITAIPFQGQEDKFSEQDKSRYRRVYEAADHRELITDGGFDNSAYHKRNDWMIANASEMMAYDSGRKIRSGTTSTIRKALLAGVEVLNLFDELEKYFQISHPSKRYLQSFPFVKSFRYGREGVIFEGHNQPLPLSFEQISSVNQEGEFLIFKLLNGVTFKASIYAEECLVDQSKIPPQS